VNDSTCLIAGDIAPEECPTNSANDTGRIGRLPVDSGIDNWESGIFNGLQSGNWFQQNGWREFIFYALAPACSGFTVFCEGAGKLTLLNAAVMPEDDKDVVLISSGRAIGPQIRDTLIKRMGLENYLED